MVATQPYIAIEGAIGVGKTTLTRILGEALQAEVLLEVFEENPFLSSFYTDRSRYAFQTQIFFLLSRYRQQHHVIADTIERTPLVSDYLFAKDWLFAHLNLQGDELMMYERVHAILGDQIPAPNLVIYLRATTDTLMQRITTRDRPYERQMDAAYIEDVRKAYEAFFSTYTLAPVLALDTNHLDIVRDQAARAEVIGQVKTMLESDLYQPLLPEMDGVAGRPPILDRGRRLPDFQRFHQVLDREKGFIDDIFLNYILLNEEVGEIGRALSLAWRGQEDLLPMVGNRQEAREQALKAVDENLQEELADALAYLLKIANDAGINLEAAYLKKMGHNWQRTWQK
jgi:deoxyguanosine kinase